MKDQTEAQPGQASDAAMAIVILALGAFLISIGLIMLERWRQSSSRMRSLQLEDVLGGASAVIGALIVSWWLVSLLLAVACAGLQKAGHGQAAAAMGRATPAFMRRLALAALGLQLIAGPVVAHAVPVSEAAGISAEWAPTAQQTGGASAYSAPQWAVTQEAKDPVVPVQPQWKPTAPPSDPRLFSAPSLRAEPTGVSPHRATQTVLAGDSLWTIAARALGPQASDLDIALDWPRWYEANRAAIGDNPDVLLPGQVLRAPSAA